MFKKLVYEGVTYDNFYVDKMGNIKNSKTNHIYRNSKSKAGYLVAYLPMGKRGKVKCIRVHKAVAETFIPNPNHYPIVHHKDEDKENPHIDNLEWVTSKENTQYHLKEESKNSEFYNNRKLTENDVKFIRSSKGKLSMGNMAKMFGVSKTTIINVSNNLLYQNVV